MTTDATATEIVDTAPDVERAEGVEGRARTP